MTSLLLDTCVLTDHLRGYEPAKVWLTEEAAKGDIRFVYSVITLTELLAGVAGSSDMSQLSGPSGASGRDVGGRQKDAILALLSLMDPIPVSVSIAAHAADYVREWGKSRGVAVPDALIAATAKDVGAVLVTRDASSFPMTDIRVCRPY